MSGAVTLPVVLPLVAAALSALLRSRRWAQRSLSVITLPAVLAVGVVLVLAAAPDPTVAEVGGWPAPLGITLVADPFAALLVIAASAAGIAVVGQAAVGKDEHRFFHPVALVLVAGANGSFLTGDLFNLFVFFEVTLLASYVLLVLGSGRPGLRAAAVYVPVNLLGSLVFLAAVALLYGQVGTLNMADLARRPELAGTAAVPGALLLAAFAVKAALVPTSGWLSLSYPFVRPPVGALFAALLTTVGVAALYRTYLVVYRADPGPRSLLIGLAIATMVTGALAAAGQTELRSALSFVVVSQAGFMVLGAALASPAAVAAGVFFIVQDMAVKAAAFLSADMTPGKELGRLRSAALAVASFSLAGIPLTSGFVGKLLLVRAALVEEAWAAAGAALASSLLILGALVRHWLPHASAERLPTSAAAVPAALMGATFVAVVWPAGLLDVAADAAALLLDPARYADAVLR